MKPTTLLFVVIIPSLAFVGISLYLPNQQSIVRQELSAPLSQNTFVKLTSTAFIPIQIEPATHITTIERTSATNKKTIDKKMPMEEGATSSTYSGPLIERIKNPYQTPPEDFSSVNVATRAALVNILCVPRSGSTSIVSGSGVIIDPRGIIITNAHVAQYVLLSEEEHIDLTCVIRAGTPAKTLWLARVLYIPQVWVREHASEIKSTKPMGTGEHDYALLRIVSPISGAFIPPLFPYLVPDAREGIGFVDDPVLSASYPLEFLGGITVGNYLYPVSSVSAIRQFLTFGTNTVDLISIGGVIGAQSGSSGGAVVNAWGRIIGVITTTSSGATTADRDLRALTMNYIDRDLKVQTGMKLDEFLNRDLSVVEDNFNINDVPAFITQFLTYLQK